MKMRRQKNKMQKNNVRRSMPFLPNFVTTIGLFFGFYSMHFSLVGDFYKAAIMIFCAGFIDAIDGRIARATNSTSAFGKEYDSLSDVICFGVAPALMLYLWRLNAYGRYGFMICFLFMACGALRLARFNTDTTSDGSKFTGLPIPVAATSMASVILLAHELGQPIPDLPLWDNFVLDPILAGTFLLAFLMVSTIKYPSFKHVNYIKAHPFQLLVAGLLLLVVVALAPEVMFFAIAMTFVFGGLILNLVQAIMRRKKGAYHEAIPREDHHI